MLPVVVAVLLALLLIGAAVVVPKATGWDVHARNDAIEQFAPWHGWWDPHVGPGTLPAVLLGVAAVVWSASLAARLSWGKLLAVAYVTSLGWLFSLALVDGLDGLTRVLGNPHEYLQTARSVGAIGPMLNEWVDRIPAAAPNNWPTHVAGHPPGMLLFFVALVRVGLGGDLAAGVVVTLVAASIVPAVLMVLRRLDLEAEARRVAPFVVFTPAAVYLAVSADAVMAAVGAWAMVLLAHAATAPRPRRALAAAVGGGALFGTLVLMSYGLTLFALVAFGLIVATRSYRLILPVGAAAAVVVLAPGVAGFWWADAFTVLRERYWDGIASERPGAYWTWANLALLAATAGPVVAAGFTRLRALPRPLVGIVVGAMLAIVVADLSQMSRAEVERIWLPFIPWLTLGLVALPDRWMRVALASQVVVALALQHLMYTSW